MNAPQAARGERHVAFASVLVLTSCVFAFGVGERRLAEQAAANDDAAATLHADEAALSARPGVAAQAARLRTALAAADREAHPTLLASAFLADALREAGARRTAITLLAADGPRTAAGGGAAFRLGLEGRYADVLATMRSFSRLRVPGSLTLTTLTRTKGDGGETVIAAALRVELQRGALRSADARSQ